MPLLLICICFFNAITTKRVILEINMRFWVKWRTQYTVWWTSSPKVISFY